MEDNEWETIQPPSSSATQSDEDDAVVVVVTSHDGEDDAHLQEPAPATPSSPSSYSSSSSSSSTPASTEEVVVHGEFPEPEAEPRPPEVRDTIPKAGFGVLSSWVLRIAYGIRTKIGFWSIASVAALVTVVAYGRRWQRWRRLAEKESSDQLALLVKQKDEKIKQLLLKIDQMNEALSAQRRVPVLRVVVDSPFMIGPRANWKPT